MRTGTLVPILALLLTLAILTSGCQFTTGQTDGFQQGAPSTNPSRTETESQPDQQERLDLSLDIEITLDQDQASLGPFYGFLPEFHWSPNGRYLAIFGEKNGYGLWLWDQQTKTGRRLVQLLDRSGQRLTSLSFFGWSKSGDSLLYAVDGVQSEGQLLGQNGVLVQQVNLDGTNKVLAWLPGEGTFIRSQLFNQESGLLILHRGQKLWAVDTNKCGQYKEVKSDLPLWEGLFSIVPSPTGEKVVYPEPDINNHQLIILDTNSGKEVTVGISDEYAFFPVWSPDGEKLAFLSADATKEGYDFQIGEDGPLPPSTKIVVVTKQGRLLTQVVSQHREKIGAPVWAPDSRRLAFLTASVIQRPKEFPKVKWRRLGMVDLQGNLQDLGTVSGDWLTIGGYTPDGDSVLLFIYETGGQVSAVLQGKANKIITLTQNAVDEIPTWWKGRLILPGLTGDNGDYLETQYFLYDLHNQATVLTSGPGWKSGIQVSTKDCMAYTSADNQNYPYPLTVVIKPLPSR